MKKKKGPRRDHTRMDRGQHRERTRMQGDHKGTDRGAAERRTQAEESTTREWTARQQRANSDTERRATKRGLQSNRDREPGPRRGPRKNGPQGSIQKENSDHGGQHRQGTRTAERTMN